MCPPSSASMDHLALAGTRVLVAGGERQAADALGAELRAAGSPSVHLAPGLEQVATQAALAAPDVVLVLGPAEPVPAVLDPLGLHTGPPVVRLEEPGGCRARAPPSRSGRCSIRSGSTRARPSSGSRSWGERGGSATAGWRTCGCCSSTAPCARGWRSSRRSWPARPSPPSATRRRSA